MAINVSRRQRRMADDNLSDRLRTLEQNHATLNTDFTEFKLVTQRNLDRLESMLGSLREEMKDVGTRLSDGLDKVNSSLNNVTSSALQSAPKWITEALERKSTIINVLCAIAAGVASALLTVVFRH